MSVLINGMEMPTSCMLCPFCVEEADPANGEMCMVTGKLMPPCTRVRLDNCPLVHVPPHGDLIDKSGVDVLSWMEDPEKDFADGVLFVLDKLDELPVIIPAEGDDYETPVEEGE